MSILHRRRHRDTYILYGLRLATSPPGTQREVRLLARVLDPGAIRAYGQNLMSFRQNYHGQRWNAGRRMQRSDSFGGPFCGLTSLGAHNYPGAGKFSPISLTRALHRRRTDTSEPKLQIHPSFRPFLTRDGCRDEGEISWAACRLSRSNLKRHCGASTALSYELGIIGLENCYDYYGITMTLRVSLPHAFEGRASCTS